MKDRIRQVREDLKLSQRDMAERIGGSYKGWQGYESGHNVPGGLVLQSLANLEYNVNWILTGEGSMKTNTQEPFSVVGIPESIRPTIEAAIEVLVSNEKGTALALTQNIHEFHEKVHERREYAEMKRDLEIIKKRLLVEPRETDFKLMGTKGAGTGGGDSK